MIVTASLSTVLCKDPDSLQHIVLRRSETDRAEFMEEMSYINANMI